MALTIFHDIMQSGAEEPADCPASLARVLLVEDDDLLRPTMAETLRKAGFEVIEASTGDRAAEILATRPVDIVVTDHRMPGLLDGLSLARLIAETLHHVPVLLVTGALPAGADGAPGVNWPAILKPFRSRELLSRIREALPELKDLPVGTPLSTHPL